MTQEEAKLFLEDNREALVMLGDKLKEIDTIKDVPDMIELRARQIAIERITNWIIEIFNIKEGQMFVEREEENVFIKLDKGRDEL